MPNWRAEDTRHPWTSWRRIARSGENTRSSTNRGKVIPRPSEPVANAGSWTHSSTRQKSPRRRRRGLGALKAAHEALLEVAEITATLIQDIEFALEDFEHYDLKRKVET